MPAGSVTGKADMGNVHEEASRVVASQMKKDYESKEWAIGGGGVADYDFKAGQSAFVKFPRAHNVIVRTSADISIKFNAASEDAITITAGEGAFSIGSLEVTNIFFTSAGAANVKVVLS